VFAGEFLATMATEGRGASNARAKRELGWTLRYPSWRQGFVASYATIGQSTDRTGVPSG
jgi:Ser/Thr protein kinase RdoA (MazF antagonist)